MSPFKAFFFRNVAPITFMGGFALTLATLAIAGQISFAMPEISTALAIAVLYSLAFIVFGGNLPEKQQSSSWWIAIALWGVTFIFAHAWQLALALSFWACVFGLELELSKQRNHPAAPTEEPVTPHETK